MWSKQFEQLRAFKERFGHCNVKWGWKENPALVHWVATQRAHRKQGILSKERVQRLEELGFDWNLTRAGKAELLEVRYAELLHYKQAHGNCDVPSEWKENPKLGGWVAGQRHLKKRGKLSQERERLLNEIGFIWDKRSRPRS
jgi:hypothetical protein